MAPWWPRERRSAAELVSTVDRRLAQTRQVIEAKKEARRQRRNLKESGDYLGVQGVNPETGQLDVVTPSDSERSSTSQETQQKVSVLLGALRDARHSYKHAKTQGNEASGTVLESDTTKVQRLGQHVTWRQTRQWSSAQEPELSPVVQSLAGSEPGSRRPSKQHRMEQTAEASLIDVTAPTRPAPRPRSSEAVTGSTTWRARRPRRGSYSRTA